MLKAYREKITLIHQELGIPASYESQRKLPIQKECSRPVSAGLDIFNREAFMDSATLLAWQGMQTTAEQQGITLQLVSAFRSVEYQEESFEDSPAFEWLCKHAAEHDFSLSFPRDNQQGFLYEPWHWCHSANNS